MADKSAQVIAPTSFEPLTPGDGPEKTGIPPSRLILGGVLLLFVLALWFLLTARSLEISVRAEEPSQIAIGGLALPFGDRYLLRSGSYQLRVTAPGYRPYDSEIVITREASQRIEVVMQPLPGRLTIESLPQGATLAIDGEAVAQTPVEDLAVEAGEHELRLEADRYLPLIQDLSITGREVQQRLSLTMEQAWADVTIDSDPAGATVVSGDETLGETPVTVELLAGEHLLTLSLPAYADIEVPIIAEAGVAQDLGTLPLTPASGVLRLRSTPSSANVSVNGTFAGQTPTDLELEPDRSHRIVVSTAGYQRSTITVQLEAGSTADRSLRLDPLLGDVVIKVTPADAELFVNGSSRGRGNQTLALAAVLQKLEFQLDGYESITRSVTPRPGLEQLVEVVLMTPEEARKARLTPTIRTALGQQLVLMNPIDSPMNEFSMGASRRDPGRRANEVLHPVRLERPFYFQDKEVTNAQFRQFQSSHGSGQIEGNSLNREHQPVAQVSWQQAASFCNWLSRREGLTPFYTEQQGIIIGFNATSLGYRLPTEAEWAWVARAEGKTLRRFSWGEEFPPKDKVENVADNSSAYVTGRILNGYDDGYVVSAPVGSFTANHRGIFDLGGNVSEWIHDVYKIPAASGVVVKDPLGAQRGDNYVIRGASWSLGRLPELRLSYRDYGQAGRDDVGFRIARYAE